MLALGTDVHLEVGKLHIFCPQKLAGGLWSFGMRNTTTNNELWNFNTNVLLEDNSELLHKCCGWELIMTDVQCREERGRKYSLYNTPLSPSFPPLQPPTSPLPVRSLLELMHAASLLLVLLCVFHLAVHLLFPTSSSSAGSPYPLHPHNLPTATSNSFTAPPN